MTTVSIRLSRGGRFVRRPRKGAKMTTSFYPLESRGSFRTLPFQIGT